MSSRPLVYDLPSPGTSSAPVRGSVQRSEAMPSSGPAAAAVLAAGLGCFTLGLLSVLTAAGTWFSDALTLSDRVGDISGITTLAAAVFLVGWAALRVAWRGANPSLVRVAFASGVLIVLGLLGTFPPFFNAVG
jgi:hypothetical protein